MEGLTPPAAAAPSPLSSSLSLRTAATATTSRVAAPTPPPSRPSSRAYVRPSSPDWLTGSLPLRPSLHPSDLLLVACLPVCVQWLKQGDDLSVAVSTDSVPTGLAAYLLKVGGTNGPTARPTHPPQPPACPPVSTSQPPAPPSLPHWLLPACRLTMRRAGRLAGRRPAAADSLVVGLRLLLC